MIDQRIKILCHPKLRIAVLARSECEDTPDIDLMRVANRSRFAQCRADVRDDQGVVPS